MNLPTLSEIRAVLVKHDPAKIYRVQHPFLVHPYVWPAMRISVLISDYSRIFQRPPPKERIADWVAETCRPIVGVAP